MTTTMPAGGTASLAAMRYRTPSPDQIPKSPSGKILRRVLVERETTRTAQAAGRSAPL